MKLELTDAQLANLKLFLNRSTLQGAEITAFVELVNLLNQSPKAQTEIPQPKK